MDTNLQSPRAPAGMGQGKSRPSGGQAHLEMLHAQLTRNKDADRQPHLQMLEARLKVWEKGVAERLQHAQRLSGSNTAGSDTAGSDIAGSDTADSDTAAARDEPQAAMAATPRKLRGSRRDKSRRSPAATAPPALAPPPAPAAVTPPAVVQPPVGSRGTVSRPRTPTMLRDIAAKRGRPRPFYEDFDERNPKGLLHGFAFTSTSKGLHRTCNVDKELLAGKDLRARLRTLATVTDICLLDWDTRMEVYSTTRNWDINGHETASIRHAIRRAREVAAALRKDLAEARTAPAGTFLDSDLDHLQQKLADLERQQRTWQQVLGSY
jgi:hypothetical protein